MTRLAAAAIACAGIACGPASERVVVGGVDRVPAVRETRGSPHGTTIAAIAVTEAGDVALTSDQGGGLRLWPALDGSRQPVAIDAVAATDLALGVRDDELAAAMIDRAGGVRVLVLGRDGRVHARAQVAGEIAARQIAAIGSDFLIRRADESIERVDASGVSRGRIAARPGERLGAIAVRGGAALVAIIGETPRLRWISLGDTLAWGGDVSLPQTIDPELVALAPGRERVAVGAARAGREPELAVYALRDGDALPLAMPGIDVPNGASIGFVSDDRVAVAGGTAPVAWWIQKGADYEPWVAPSAPARTQTKGRFLRGRGGGGDAAAYGDGVAAVGFGAGIDLAAPEGNHYLGWRELVMTGTWPIGDSVAYGPDDGRFLWVDHTFANARSFDMSKIPGGETFGAVAIGEHEISVQTRGKSDVRLVDTRTPETPIDLGEFGAVGTVAYEPSLHVLAIEVPHKIMRFRIDHDPLRATPLPSLRYDQSVYQLRLLDPAKSGGVEAIVVGSDENGERLYTFKGSRVSSVQLDGMVAAIDSAGTVYLNAGLQIEAHRGGKLIGKFETAGVTRIGAASHDNAHLALFHQHDVALADTHGTISWQREVWGAYGATFSDDDRTVYVRTSTGLLALDAATGEPSAQACGWEFGLHDSGPPQTYGAQTVCEDIER